MMIIQSNNLKQQFRKRIPFYNPIPSKRSFMNSKKIEQLKEKNEKEEDFSKSYFKGIKKLKNKGELSLGEHNRKNILVDTDSEESISFEESKKNNNKKGTTKLLVSKTEQASPNSTRKNLLNLKEQKKKEKLSKYIIKTERRNNKNFQSPNHLFQNYNNNTSIFREYNIKIPGSISRTKKRYNNIEESSEDELKENDSEIISQNFINMETQRNLRQRFSHQRNLEIIISPDMKITNVKIPNNNNNKSPIPNNNNYYMDNNINNISCIYNDYQINKNNLFSQKSPLIVNNNNNQYLYYSDKRQNQNKAFYPNTNNINNYSGIYNYIEASPISSFKYSSSPQRSPGGKVELKINQFNNSNKKHMSQYKDKMYYIVLLQRYIRDYIKVVNKKIKRIQSFWRGYWLRKIIYIRLIMFYKGQALIEHIMNFYSKLVKRNLKNLIYKCSFKPKKQVQYIFPTDKIQLINRLKTLNLGYKKNYFDKEILKINKNSSFTFKGILNDLNQKSKIEINSIIKENEKKFEELYYELLQKYEELKNQSYKFNEKLMEIEKNNLTIIEKNKMDDKKILNQAFYLKESKINKFSFDKNSSEENENEDELLKEGEILIPDDKLNKEIERINRRRNDKKLRNNKRINLENKEEEFFKKDKEDITISQRRFIINKKEKDENDKKKSSYSNEIIYNKKQSKFDLDDNLNIKTFKNIQIDYSFKNVNIIPIKKNRKRKKENDIINENVIKNEDEFTIENTNKLIEEKDYYKEINQLSDSDEDLNNKEKRFNKIRIQNNCSFSVIDRKYMLDQLPIIEEEKEELISIQNHVNDIFINNSKKENIKNIKFSNLEIEQNICQVNILKENKLILEKKLNEKVKYDINIIEVQIKGNDKIKKRKVKEFNNLIHDDEKIIINLIGNKKKVKKRKNKESEENENIKSTKKESLKYKIEHFELINKGKIKKETKLQLIKEENKLVIPNKNKVITLTIENIELKILSSLNKKKNKIYLREITLLNKNTLLYKLKKKELFNYSIDNEEFSIEGNEKEEKGIQTKTTNLKLQKDYFSIEKEYKSLEKDNNFILKKLKPTILSKKKKK